MISLKRVLPLIALIAFLFPFTKAQGQGKADVELSTPSARSIGNMKFNPRQTASTWGKDEDDYSPGYTKPASALLPTVVGPDYTVEVMAHNMGTKTVKAITWEFSFFADINGKRLFRGQKIRNKKRIAPGATETLFGRVSYPVSQRSQYQRAKPLRIEYTDGTVWNMP